MYAVPGLSTITVLANAILLLLYAHAFLRDSPTIRVLAVKVVVLRVKAA